jgi:hypothetical protein
VHTDGEAYERFMGTVESTCGARGSAAADDRGEQDVSVGDELHDAPVATP